MRLAERNALAPRAVIAGATIAGVLFTAAALAALTPSGDAASRAAAVLHAKQAKGGKNHQNANCDEKISDLDKAEDLLNNLDDIIAKGDTQKVYCVQINNKEFNSLEEAGLDPDDLPLDGVRISGKGVDGLKIGGIDLDKLIERAKDGKHSDHSDKHHDKRDDKDDESGPGN